MKISYNWLKEYVKTDLAPEEVSRILTQIGLEVEGIEHVESIRGGLAGLVVAEVLTCEKHPDADKLSVTTVSTGAETFQVVCGAPNVAVGQKVVLATVGATLYPVGEEDGFKIKKSKIRGVESLGMLCAEDEIGVGTSHDGIIVLSADAKVGAPAAQVFDMQGDTVFEIGLTPNRVDAASHYGVARDLAAYLTSEGIVTQAKLPDVSKFKEAGDTVPVEVVVENAKAAPRYMGVTVSGITVAPSPEWLQNYLRTIGINPKNNIVDITNFILHECGQPLHAFDMACVKGSKIVVKNCEEGTLFVTLDGVERKLANEDLMICNAEKPMCIAGVFGGMESGVSDTTTSVFIESAYFNSVSVRKTAKRHGLSTDASFRYERGADPNIAPYALKRCATMICELAGGHVSSKIADLYPVTIENFKVIVSPKRINALIGKEIPAAKIEAILLGLEIEIVAKGDEEWVLSVPPYRVDVQREADIVEEVLRIYGFNNVENPEGIKSCVTLKPRVNYEKVSGIISELLSSRGCSEMMGNSLSSSAYYTDLTSYPSSSLVRIANPLSQELDCMRQTLLFNALEAVQLNANRRRNDLKLYELGACYSFNPENGGQGLKPFVEQQRLAITVCGNNALPSWNLKPVLSDFFTVKSLIDNLLQRIGISLTEGVWESYDSDLYAEAARYTMRGVVLFEIGRISRKALTAFDLKTTIHYAEINMDALVKFASTVKVRVSELNKFQPVKRDLALLVDKNVTFDALRTAAEKSCKNLLKNVALFDVYEGDKLPVGKKSYALGFTLEDCDKTLSDKEIERAMANISAALEKAAGAQIRS